MLQRKTDSSLVSLGRVAQEINSAGPKLAFLQCCVVKWTQMLEGISNTGHNLLREENVRLVTGMNMGRFVPGALRAPAARQR